MVPLRPLRVRRPSRNPSRHVVEPAILSVTVSISRVAGSVVLLVHEARSVRRDGKTDLRRLRGASR